MKKFIVGAFTPESWETHGKDWSVAVEATKGDAAVLVFNTEGDETYDGTRAGVIAALGKRDGVFIFVAPEVRLQTPVADLFKRAEDRVIVFSRITSCVQRPFAGEHPAHEEFWAAPSDLLDLLSRVIDVSAGIGSSPLNFDANYMGYFVGFFPWFAEIVPEGHFAHEFDADFSDGYYSSPGGDRLIAVALDDKSAACSN